MEEREREISLRVRKSSYKKRLENLLPRVSKIVGRTLLPDAVVDLESSEDLCGTFFAAYRSASLDGKASFAGQGNSSELFRNAENAVERCAMWNWILSRDHIVFSLRREDLRMRLAQLLELDGESICLLTPDRQKGMLLDWNIDDQERTYELTIWP